ncbi:maleylacetoacetate isomerase [Novosphingobium kunmingense]|uniref:Maleylacetoacetate isomerase n=1 Tax=Novosphingobium kunmingense TaxID=1211806 RepID=A0A2N0HKM5_9SPHN|nr:maleylacetoacetate isomerase [Novosphingobium kunmingense]PKB19506.1 maleylacetoacetate isomerase [Novosphingobium kunmingense]
MSGEVVLYDYWRSSAAYRVRIVLNLKGVAYRAIPVDLVKGEQAAADYVGLNHQGLVPTLLIDGHTLTQSLAIIDYLDVRYENPPMVSPDPAVRSRILAQALVIAADIHPINNLRVLNYLRSELGADQDAVTRWYHHWIIEGLRALEIDAPESGLMGGDLPNLADVCLVPQMANARRFAVPLEGFPKLVAIDERLRTLPAFAAAAPEAVAPPS